MQSSMYFSSLCAGMATVEAGVKGVFLLYVDG